MKRRFPSLLPRGVRPAFWDSGNAGTRFKFFWFLSSPLAYLGKTHAFPIANVSITGISGFLNPVELRLQKSRIYSASL
jgi:hypothetical protein